MKIHHLGYLVKDTEKAKAKFLDLGYSVEQDTVFDEERGVNISFLINDGYRIELVSPAREDAVVASLIKKCGNAPYHICYIADDLESEIEKLKSSGFIVIQAPKAAPAISGKRVAFLMQAALGMIELVEE